MRFERGSSRRATCMERVEPPETIRPLVTSWSAARPKRQRVDAVMLPEALVLIGEQHVEEARIDLRRGSPATASGLRLVT